MICEKLRSCGLGCSARPVMRGELSLSGCCRLLALPKEAPCIIGGTGTFSSPRDLGATGASFESWLVQLID